MWNKKVQLGFCVRSWRGFTATLEKDFRAPYPVVHNEFVDLPQWLAHLYTPLYLFPLHFALLLSAVKITSKKNPAGYKCAKCGR